MTLDAAIRELEGCIDVCPFIQPADEFYALKLGISALKKIKAVKEEWGWAGITPLPGETKE